MANPMYPPGGPPRPPHNHHHYHAHPDDFWDCFRGRGRYTSWWTQRFGLIPELPTSFDNANDLYELVAWLQRGFKQLLDDFANLELESEEFKNAILELIEILIPQLIRQFIRSEEFHDFMFDLIWEWWYNFQEERILEIERQIYLLWQEVKKLWEQIKLLWEQINLLWLEIEKIWREIDRLWERIEDLESVVFESSFDVLVEGRDYTVQYFNQYYVDTHQQPDLDIGLRISIHESYDRYLIRAESNRLRNPSTVNMIQNHGATMDTPAGQQSAIFGITFMGDYAGLNGLTTINEVAAAGTATIFNIYPKDGPYTWSPLFRVVRNYSGSSYVVTFRSLADGYNTNYSDYIDDADHSLDFGTFVYTVTALKDGV